MQNLPLYIPLLFGATVVYTLFCFYKATRHSKMIYIIVALWLLLQTALGQSLFYTDTSTIPPRFSLTLLPPIICIITLLITRRGRRLLDTLDTKWLTLLHVVRLPIEIGLLLLSLHKVVPQLMTFEGRNFDVLSGLTALLVFYFGYLRKKLSRTTLLIWNIACFLLLVNIVTIAILAAPFPFQQLALDQPNIAVLYFPYVYLPAFVVPAVLLSHVASIRQLLKGHMHSLRSRDYVETNGNKARKISIVVNEQKQQQTQII